MVYLHTAPLCHIGGLSSAMAMLMVGARHIFTPKFDAKFALQAIEQHHVTSLITVPAIMADLISIIRKNKDWTTKESVKKILNGGGGLSRELIKDVTNIFPRAKLLSAYGMTETCSSLTFLNLWDPTLKTTDLLLFYTEKLNSIDHPQGVCVGKPAPHIELKISTDGTSQAGRILTRGPHVMLGYWGESQEKKSNAAVEGWLDTGDIGSINESGNLWLVGRSNGRIKSGGENVYPEEVETILLQHPGIIAIVVVGVPDARLTEMVVACIRLRDNWQWTDSTCKQSAENHELILSSEILLHHCRMRNLTGFKLPKLFILWRKPFPLTTTGKVKRDQVRREVMLHLQFFPTSHL